MGSKSSDRGVRRHNPCQRSINGWYGISLAGLSHESFAKHSSGSVHVGMFITFRFFSGAGAFMILSAVPIWMSEVAPPLNRGFLVDLHGASLLFGYVIAMWTGYGFFFYDSINAWRAAMGEWIFPLIENEC